MTYEVVNISTTTGRYIANGILTHNKAPYEPPPPPEEGGAYTTIEDTYIDQCPYGTYTGTRTIYTTYSKPKIFYQSSYTPMLPITIQITSNTDPSANYYEFDGGGPRCTGTPSYRMVRLQFNNGRSSYASTIGISATDNVFSNQMTYNSSYVGWEAKSFVSFSVQPLAGQYVDGTFYWQAIMTATDATGRRATNSFPNGEYSFINGSLFRACLTPDTLIELYDGKNVFLKDVNIGDCLLSINPETKEYEESIVTSKSFHKVDKLYLINSGLIRCSDSHKHVVKRKDTWSELASEELLLGDIVINKNLEEIVIDSIHILN